MTDWDYDRPGPGTGIRRQTDGTYLTADERFVVHPAPTQGSSWKWVVEDQSTGECVRARTLLGARNDIRCFREREESDR